MCHATIRANLIWANRTPRGGPVAGASARGRCVCRGIDEGARQRGGRRGVCVWWERQRVRFARALIARRRSRVLDEATGAGLGERVARQRAIDSLRHNQHRHHHASAVGVRNVDVVHVLDQGNRGIGPWQDLCETRAGQGRCARHKNRDATRVSGESVLCLVGTVYASRRRYRARPASAEPRDPNTAVESPGAPRDRQYASGSRRPARRAYQFRRALYNVMGLGAPRAPSFLTVTIVFLSLSHRRCASRSGGGGSRSRRRRRRR